jgi:hypothetical protein
MTNFKVGYHKRFSKDGTVYTQSVRINMNTLISLREVRQSEIDLGFPRRKEYDPTGYHDIPHFSCRYEGVGKKATCYSYMTLTQTRFSNLFLKLNLKDRNTYLIIEK